MKTFLKDQTHYANEQSSQKIIILSGSRVQNQSIVSVPFLFIVFRRFCNDGNFIMEVLRLLLHHHIAIEKDSQRILIPARPSRLLGNFWSLASMDAHGDFKLNRSYIVAYQEIGKYHPNQPLTIPQCQVNILFGMPIFTQESGVGRKSYYIFFIRRRNCQM